MSPNPRRFFRFPWRSRSRIRADLDSELQHHLDMRTEELAAAGMRLDDARRAAEKEFGNLDLTRRYCESLDAAGERETRRVDWLAELRQDVAFALRGMARHRGFVAVALLTLALGIGANTAVFSVVRGILLRPLPYRDPERLAAVWPTTTISNGELVYLQEHAHAFDAIAAFSPGWGTAMVGAGEPRQLDVARTSANFFRVLGVQPEVGRGFTDAEASSGNWNVVVLSHALWLERFGGSRDVIGKQVQFDATPMTIIGVMPAEFEAFQPRVEAWQPLQIDPTSPFYKGQTAIGFGRLRPGVTFAVASADLAALTPEIRRLFDYADDYGRAFTVSSLQDSIVGSMRQSLYVLFGAVGFIVLIAGANVGSLLLVRGAGRRREIVLRSSLGATRGRVVRQLLTESIVLALAGGSLGLAAGAAGVRVLRGILPATLPRLAGVSVDLGVLAACAAVTLGVGLIFGLAPAVIASRTDPHELLRAGSAGAGGGRAGARVRNGLIVAETALALMLMVGAGLMLQTLWRLQRVDPGFDPRRVLTLRLSPSTGQIRAAGDTWRYYDEVRRRIAAVPGVERVGTTQHLPLTGFNWFANLDIEGQPLAKGTTPPRVVWRTVSGDYFGAMGIPLRRGRAFTGDDRPDAPFVIVINEAMARHYWPNEDPLGRRIKLGFASKGEWSTIVGVVGSVRYLGLDKPAGDEVYRPLAQQGQVAARVVVRMASDADPLLASGAIGAAIRSLDATVPISDIAPLSRVVALSVARPRTIMVLLLVFAGVGVILGAVGIYGVVSYAVSQRTRELGIRAALGAAELSLTRLVLGEGARLAVAGSAIGTVGALVAARALRTLVFGVTTTDPLTYAALAGLMIAVALAATYVPARRAARADPVAALKAE